jgi:hypothetical protein
MNAADPAPVKEYSAYDPTSTTLLGFFVPTDLTIWVNGQVESHYVKKGGPPNQFIDECSDGITLNTPNGPVTISFVALGYHRGTGTYHGN